MSEQNENTGLVVYSRPGPLTPQQLDNLKEEVKALVASRDFPLLNIEQGLARVLIGRQMGLSPAESLMGLEIVEGQLSMRGKLVASLIDNHPLYDYVVEESTDKRCTIAFSYKRDGEWVKRGTYTFTIQDAQRAGLVNKFNWKAYPTLMLFYRALSQGARMFAAPAIMGGYTEGELETPSEEEMDFSISMVDEEALYRDVYTAVASGTFNLKAIRERHSFAGIAEIAAAKKRAEEQLAQEEAGQEEVTEGEFEEVEEVEKAE